MGNCGISSFFFLSQTGLLRKVKRIPRLSLCLLLICRKSAITIKNHSHYDEEGKKNSDKPFFVVNNGLFM